MGSPQSAAANRTARSELGTPIRRRRRSNRHPQAQGRPKQRVAGAAQHDMFSGSLPATHRSQQRHRRQQFDATQGTLGRSRSRTSRSMSTRIRGSRTRRRSPRRSQHACSTTRRSPIPAGSLLPRCSRAPSSVCRQRSSRHSTARSTSRLSSSSADDIQIPPTVTSTTNSAGAFTAGNGAVPPRHADLRDLHWCGAATARRRPTRSRAPTSRSVTGTSSSTLRRPRHRQ